MRRVEACHHRRCRRIPPRGSWEEQCIDDGMHRGPTGGTSVAGIFDCELDLGLFRVVCSMRHNNSFQQGRTTTLSPELVATLPR